MYSFHCTTQPRDLRNLKEISCFFLLQLILTVQTLPLSLLTTASRSLPGSGAWWPALRQWPWSAAGRAEAGMGAGEEPPLPSPGAPASAPSALHPEASDGQADAGLLVPLLPPGTAAPTSAVEPPHPSWAGWGPSRLAPHPECQHLCSALREVRAGLARRGQVRKEERDTAKKQTRNSYPKKAPVPAWTPAGRKRGRREGQTAQGSDRASCRERTPHTLKAGASPAPWQTGRGKLTGRALPLRAGWGDPPEPTLVPTHETPAEGPAWPQAVGRALRGPAARSHGPCHSEQRGSRQSSVDAGMARLGQEVTERSAPRPRGTVSASNSAWTEQTQGLSLLQPPTTLQHFFQRASRVSHSAVRDHRDSATTF